MEVEVRPLGAGGWGAWELAVRYSRTDLNFHAGEAGQAPPPGGVRGGDQKILSLALEWYPRPRTRLMLEALRVRVDRLNPAGPDDLEPFGPPPATPPVGVQIGQSFNAVALRLRYAF
jgi:phosphate-selective porin OprO/OprP